MKIDDEFRNLIPPLSDDEYANLQASVIRDGCRDKLIVWRGRMLDGHNRHEICSLHDVRFETAEISLPDRTAALDWIINNQLSRRNLSPEQISYLRGKQYNRIKTAGHGANSAYQSDTQNTAQVMADTHKVGVATIKRDARFATALDNIDPEVKQQVLSRQSNLSRKDVIDLANHRPLVTHNSGFEEWWTPSKYIESARTVMSRIDLDPASCQQANATVKADTFYTIQDDGLEQRWRGKVWLNPPYSAGVVDKFTNKLIDAYEAGDVSAESQISFSSATIALLYGC